MDDIFGDDVYNGTSGGTGGSGGTSGGGNGGNGGGIGIPQPRGNGGGLIRGLLGGLINLPWRGIMPPVLIAGGIGLAITVLYMSRYYIAVLLMGITEALGVIMILVTGLLMLASAVNRRLRRYARYTGRAAAVLLLLYVVLAALVGI